MPRQDDRKAFLVSAVAHVAIMMVVLNGTVRKFAEAPPLKPVERKRLVFLPPPEMLRAMAPRPAPTAQAPRPTPPPPPPPDKKSTFYVGNLDDERRQVIALQRDQEIGHARSGSAQPSRSEALAPTRPDPAAPRTAESSGASPPRAAATTPFGAGNPMPQNRTAQQAPPAAASVRSIASALQALEQRAGDPASKASERAAGQQMGGLYFDPQGADFTAWTNGFYHETYRNWIVPQPASLGMRGHVDLQFTVLRDGSVRDVRILKSAGIPAFDRAAENALTASRYPVLPADFGPDFVVIQATFVYNERAS